MGINGIDCAGKTNFTGEVERYLQHQGYPFQLVHLDEFLQPRSVRGAGGARLAPASATRKTCTPGIKEIPACPEEVSRILSPRPCRLDYR